MNEAPAARTRFSVPFAQGSLLIGAAVLAVAWLYLSAEHRIAGEWGYALDDSWIHATFARNLATGHGFSFNPGEPVAGSTGPLYTLVLSLLFLAFHDVVWPAKILGIACQIGASIAVYAAVRAILPRRPGLALGTGLLTASAPPLAWGMLSGMEIPLYLLLACAGLAFYLRGRRVAATLLWAIGVWVRPDGLFLLALGILGPPREMARRLAVALPIVAAFFAFNVAVAGHVMPQSVTAKTTLQLDLPGRTWTILRECAALWGVPYGGAMPPVLPFLLLGAALSVRARPILAAYAVGFPLALSLFQPVTGPANRYVLYVIPFGLILVALAADHMDAWLRDRWRHAGATLVAVCLALQAYALPAHAELYGWNVQNIDKMQITLAKFARLATQPGDAIAVNDIGAMGYFSDRYVVDLVGLVTPPRGFAENLTRYHPKLLIIFESWFKRFAREDPASGNYLFFDADSTHRYELLAGVELKRNTICGGDRMTAYVRLGPGDPSPTQRWLYVF